MTHIIEQIHVTLAFKAFVQFSVNLAPEDAIGVLMTDLASIIQIIVRLAFQALVLVSRVLSAIIDRVQNQAGSARIVLEVLVFTGFALISQVVS